MAVEADLRGLELLLEAELAFVLAHCPQLRVLHLPNVAAKGIATISQLCPGLEVLTLHCIEHGDSRHVDLGCLAACRGLKTLCIDTNGMSTNPFAFSGGLDSFHELKCLQHVEILRVDYRN